MIQWRYDMENAPRDAEELLLWDGRLYEGRWSHWLNSWSWYDAQADWGECATVTLTPTAWASINAPEGEG